MHEKHWVTCCINLLCKELNTFDSIRSTKKGCATEKVISNLVCKLVLFQAFLSFLLSHIFVLFHYFHCFFPAFLLVCRSQTFLHLQRRLELSLSTYQHSNVQDQLITRSSPTCVTCCFILLVSQDFFVASFYL